jgi:hypothetical protein
MAKEQGFFRVSRGFGPHASRCGLLHHDAEYYIVGSSAPPDIGVQIWSHYMIPGMVARIISGHSEKKVIDWAKAELKRPPPLSGRLPTAQSGDMP